MLKKILLLHLSLLFLKANSQSLEDFSGIEGIDSNYFKYPSSLILKKGNIILSDTGNHILRTISKKNTVETFAGNGLENVSNGNLVNTSFKLPEDIVIDSKQNIYVVDDMHQIRKISPKGQVSTYAGVHVKGWIDGGIDGKKESAVFKFITGLTIDKKDNIYIADKHQIRKIENKKNIITIAGNYEAGDKVGIAKNSQFYQISDITINSKQELFVADQVNGKVKKIVNDSIVSRLAPNKFGVIF